MDKNTILPKHALINNTNTIRVERDIEREMVQFHVNRAINRGWVLYVLPGVFEQ